MPERILPGLGLRAFYEPGQRDWGDQVSVDLRLVSALVQARALSRSTPLPASGSLGDIFIVPGAAATNANNIALWDGAPGAEAWVSLTPKPGWEIWILDEGLRVRFDGAAWQALLPPGVVPVRTLIGATHTLELTDTGSILETTGASAVTVTIPDEATVSFATGTLINITQAGAGVATVEAAAGVSLNSVSGGSVALEVQWSGVALTKRGADAWSIQGALAGAVA
jgi:hypothetical protein